MEKTEAELTETATKRVKEQRHALGPSAPLSFDPAEIRGIGLIEAIDEGWLAVDEVAADDGNEDWVIVGGDKNPVSQMALSNCQHKLRNES